MLNKISKYYKLKNNMNYLPNLCQKIAIKNQ